MAKCLYLVLNPLEYAIFNNACDIRKINALTHGSNMVQWETKRDDAHRRSAFGSTEYQTVTSIRDETVICFLEIFGRHATVIVSGYSEILINLWEFTVDVAGRIARHVLGVEEDHCFLYKHWRVIAIGHQEVEVSKVADSINNIK